MYMEFGSFKRYRKMKKVLQKIADIIYKNLISTKTEETFKVWFDIGMVYNNMMINKYSIYLN